MSHQRSYFIQPKSGSDWSSSARLSDQEILKEFEKMSLPSYYRTSEMQQPLTQQPMESTEYFQQPSEREYQFAPQERNIPVSIIPVNEQPEQQPIETYREPEYLRSATTDNLTNRILSAHDQPVEISKRN